MVLERTAGLLRSKHPAALKSSSPPPRARANSTHMASTANRAIVEREPAHREPGSRLRKRCTRFAVHENFGARMSMRYSASRRSCPAGQVHRRSRVAVEHAEPLESDPRNVAGPLRCARIRGGCSGSVHCNLRAARLRATRSDSPSGKPTRTGRDQTSAPSWCGLLQN